MNASVTVAWILKDLNPLGRRLGFENKYQFVPLIIDARDSYGIRYQRVIRNSRGHHNLLESVQALEFYELVSADRNLAFDVSNAVWPPIRELPSHHVHQPIEITTLSGYGSD